MGTKPAPVKGKQVFLFHRYICSGLIRALTAWSYGMEMPRTDAAKRSLCRLSHSPSHIPQLFQNVPLCGTPVLFYLVSQGEFLKFIPELDRVQLHVDFLLFCGFASFLPHPYIGIKYSPLLQSTLGHTQNCTENL